MIALIGLSLFSAFAEGHGQASTSRSLAIAALTIFLMLLDPPALRPPDTQAAVPRSASVAFTGRLAILAVWLVRALISGFSAYFIFSRLHHHPGFQGRVALLTVAQQLLALVAQCARSMAGFRPDWGFSRDVPSVLRYLLNKAVLICLAGYASTLPGLAETALTWVPNHVPGYHFWPDLLPAWLAVPLTVVVWFYAVLVALSVLQWLLAAALGQENPLGEWLDDNSPITYRRTDTSVTFDFDFWLIRIFYYNSYAGRAFWGRLLLEVKYSSDFPGYGRGPTARQRRKWQVHEQPLTDEERHSLRERITAAIMAQAPPEWDALTLEYRAVVAHQEVQLEVNPPGSGPGWVSSEDQEEDDGGDGAGRTVVQLPDFPERDALWRLREASYSVDRGVDYTQVMTVHKAEPTHGDHRSWRLISPVWDRERQPSWHKPPTARQYRKDLRCFPTRRSRQPFWLRNKVKRIG